MDKMEWYGLHLHKESLKNGVQKDTPLTALAFFLGAPQTWRKRSCAESYTELFRTTLKDCTNLSSEQVVVHGCYLMNPASEKEEVVAKTKPMFLNELSLCERMNVGKYVFHPGCSKDVQRGLQCTADLIKAGLEETKHTQILVENMTQTNRLCQSWEECRWILDHVNDPRLGFCLDTAHCWGAGPKKGMFMDTLLNDFDRIVGIDRLRAIHLNDSKVALGANKDRHENLLQGQIPYSFWNSFIFDERVRRVPTILEMRQNCHPVLKIIIENGRVPNTEPKERITVTVIKKELPEINSEEVSIAPDRTPLSLQDRDLGSERSSERIKQSSLDSFFVSTNSTQDNNPVEMKNSVPSYTTLEKKVENILLPGVAKIVTEFLPDYEKLEEFIPERWRDALSEEIMEPYFQKLKQMLIKEKGEGHNIFPPTKFIFKAFRFKGPDEIRVVLCGQDCYIRKGQAEGLSFSVPKGVKVPPSLKNIYKELESDIRGFKPPYHGNLIKWAEQGVFLLNASLTVREGKSNSHKSFGWLHFTGAVLRWLNDYRENLVFILMGRFAQEQCSFVDTKRHCVIKTVHPSPLAGGGFSGSKPFSKCNEYLRSKGIPEITWRNY